MFIHMVVQSIFSWIHHGGTSPDSERLVQIRDLLRRNRLGHLNGGMQRHLLRQPTMVDQWAWPKNAENTMLYHVTWQFEWGNMRFKIIILHVGLFPCFSQHVLTHVRSSQDPSIWQLCAMVALHGGTGVWSSHEASSFGRTFQLFKVCKLGLQRLQICSVRGDASRLFQTCW